MADYNYIDTTGVIVPDTSDTQAQVEQEFRDAFGQDLNVKQGPQQVLIAAEVSARQAVARNNAALANQLNPALAGGVFLDAIWALTGGGRIAATASVVAAVALTGVPGTLIPGGSVAATAAGDRFVSAGDVTLGDDGAASVDFIAEEVGPVPCAIGALSAVVSAVLGWETVTNADAATLGQDEESDAASRLRRRDTLALQGVALPEAIISELRNSDGVRSLQFRENTADTPDTIDGIDIDAHSFWVCVDGGTDDDVAAAILAAKSGGAGMTGATVVDVTEPASGQVYPVKFDRPAAVPVLARVTVRNVSAIGDPTTLVKGALVAYAGGTVPGEAGLTVGRAVSPFELAGAVNIQAVGLYVQKLEVAYAAGGVYQTTELAIAINEIATLDAASITVITA